LNTSGYPCTHPSVEDNPLCKKSVHELKALLDAKKISYVGLTDKDSLVQLCIDNGIKE
jgi:hypothetical protein